MDRIHVEIQDLTFQSKILVQASLLAALLDQKVLRQAAFHLSTEAEGETAIVQGH